MASSFHLFLPKKFSYGSFHLLRNLKNLTAVLWTLSSSSLSETYFLQAADCFVVDSAWRIKLGKEERGYFVNSLLYLFISVCKGNCIWPLQLVNRLVRPVILLCIRTVPIQPLIKFGTGQADFSYIEYSWKNWIHWQNQY